MAVTDFNFDGRAREWDADPLKVERARAVAEAIRQAVHLGSDSRALEYGCGTGLLSFALHNDFASITLADTSRGMLDVLAEKIKTARVTNLFPVLLDLVKEPLPPDHFQIIYSLMTLHHILNTVDILGKFHSLLEPGGYLCISDLDHEDGSFHGTGVMDVHHGFNRKTLQTQAEGVGFKGVHFSTVFEIPKANRIYPLFLMIARK